MAEFDNTNGGVLFKNDKATSEKAPQYKGTLNVQGKEFEIAAWVREGKSGKKFMSLKVSEPFEPKQKPQIPQTKQHRESDTDLPF
jgi:uncharacterized protein (DUF736 family)